MLRPDRRVIESCGNGMCELDLAVVVCEQPGFRALQDTEFATLETRSVSLRNDSIAARLDTDHAHMLVTEKRMEQTDRIRSAAHTCNQKIRQASFAFQNLLASLDTDHPMEISNNHRKRM